MTDKPGYQDGTFTPKPTPIKVRKNGDDSSEEEDTRNYLGKPRIRIQLNHVPSNYSRDGGYISKYIKDSIIDEYAYTNMDVDPSIYINTHNNVCPLIGKDINVITSMVGKGKYGEALKVTFSDNPTKEYIVKIINVPTLPLNSTMLTYDIETNNIDPVLVQVLKLQKNMLSIKYYKKCLVEKYAEYKSNIDSNDILIVHKDSIMCSSSEYTEYIIGALLGQLKLQGTCLNFVENFNFSLCLSEDSAHIYNFMEYINGIPLYTQLYNNYKYHDGETSNLDIIILQILFAVETMQRLGINHNDLHPGNVLLTYLPLSSANDTEIFNYNIDGVNLCFPLLKYDNGYGPIVKIIDFGYACKFSDVKILNKNVIENKHSGLVPNVFNSSYDIMMVLYLIHLQRVKSNTAMNVLKQIIPDNVSSYFNAHNKPIVTKLKLVEEPGLCGNILKTSDIFEKYRKDTKSFYTLGTI